MSKQALSRHTEREIAAWRRTAKAGDALNDGGGLHLRRQSLGDDGKGRDYWVMRFTSPESGKRGWLAVWGDAALPYPQATTDEARKRAQAMRTKLADGVDPLAAKRRDADAKREDEQRAMLAAERRLTVRKLFEQWQRVELAPHTLADGTRTGRKDGGQWVLESFERRLFPKLGEVSAEDVRKADLLAILDDCKAGGQRRTANVLLADIRQMFRFAAERDIVPRNPLEGIKRASIGGKDVERDRVLTADEVHALWPAVKKANMGPRSVAAVWLILATACRVGEVMGARWEHVNLTARTWYLPDTKNERDHLIHLSDFALQQFATLLDLREVGSDGQPLPWVFPDSKGTGPVCVKSFGKQLADRQRETEKRMVNRAKNTRALALAGGKWTAHDLRRTAATLMAGAGVSTDVIDECLNHKLQSKVARVYIKERRLSEQARAFDILGAKLAAIVSGTAQPSNVVALDAARIAA